MANKPRAFLRRTAAEVKRYRTIMRITPIILGALAILLALIYIITVLYSKYGSFTVTIQKYDALKYSLSLSFTEEFEQPTSILNGMPSKDITNIEGSTLPDYLDKRDGVYSGDNFAAYTFYCKNSGEGVITYQYKLFIANKTKDIEKAIRVRLYVDGVPTTYAYYNTTNGQAETDTVTFQDDVVIVQDDIVNFAPGDKTKFTVVIWLEGPDDDCVDKILGGQFKIGMTMSVVGVDAQ